MITTAGGPSLSASGSPFRRRGGLAQMAAWLDENCGADRTMLRSGIAVARSGGLGEGKKLAGLIMVDFG